MNADQKKPDELDVLVVADCAASETLVHTVVGHQVASAHRENASDGGTTEKQVFYVDEPPFLGGEGRHPQPLTYVAGGIGA